MDALLPPIALIGSVATSYGLMVVFFFIIFIALADDPFVSDKGFNIALPAAFIIPALLIVGVFALGCAFYHVSQYTFVAGS